MKTEIKMENTISFKREFSLFNPQSPLIIFEMNNGEFWSAVWHRVEGWGAFKVELNFARNEVVNHHSDSKITSDSFDELRTAIWNKVNEKELV